MLPYLFAFPNDISDHQRNTGAHPGSRISKADPLITEWFLQECDRNKAAYQLDHTNIGTSPSPNPCKALRYKKIMASGRKNQLTVFKYIIA